MTTTDQPTPRTDAAQIERQEYEEATRECDRIALPERPKDAWELCRELERELEDERALADRLANALVSAVTWGSALPAQEVLPAYEAWEEARNEPVNPP